MADCRESTSLGVHLCANSHGQGEHDARGEHSPGKKNVVAVDTALIARNALIAKNMSSDQNIYRPSTHGSAPASRLGRDEVERVDVPHGIAR